MFLIAGLSAATVGAAMVTPVSAPAPVLSMPAMVAAPAIDLSATTLPLPPPASPLGLALVNGYSIAQPYVEYGFELADYALSFVPGLWWVAPGIDLAYFTVEPLVESLVFSTGYLLGGQIGLIPTAITTGVQAAAANFVNYGLDWINSLVPLPPLPPLPPFPGAASSPVSARVANPSAADPSAPSAPVRPGARVRAAAATSDATESTQATGAPERSAAADSAAKPAATQHQRRR